MEFYQEHYHAILDVLHRDANTEDAYAVRRSCHELARLVVWRRSARLHMIEGGLLHVLHPTIELHAEQSADVIVDFCRFLRRCISLKEPTELDIQSKVTEAGYLRVFRVALESHPNSEAVLNEVCRVLALLCFDMPNAPHADNQVEIAEQQVLVVLTDRLREPLTRSEESATLCCEAIFSVVYENEATANQALEECSLLSCLSDLLARFPSSKSVVQVVVRTLFQIKTLSAQIHDEFIELQFFERALDFLESNRDDCDALLLWHVLKFFEVAIRDHERSKEEFCRCRGPATVIRAIQYARGATKRVPQLLGCLYYVSCMVFCRLALSSDGPAGAWPVAKHRVDHLMQSGAHQFALQVLKTSGSEPTHVAEQAVRVLELVASIEANRIPLTRLGASRQVKVVYNSTAHPGLMVLCERAVAAIEGT